MYPTKKHIAYVIFLLFAFNLYSQPSYINYSNWFFGDKAGLSFEKDMSGHRELLSNLEILYTKEGISTYSDYEGNIKLSCNGLVLVHFYDNSDFSLYKTFEIDSFRQNESSANSNMIIQSLSNKDQFYIFCVSDMQYDGKFNYRIFDTSLDNGRGDWVGDFIAISENDVSEKIAAIYDYDYGFYWILCQEKLNFPKCNLLIYKLDSNDNLSHYSSFSFPFKKNQLGDLKFSKDGKYLACTSGEANYLEIYDFDFQTANLNLKFSLKDTNYRPNSIEFSADNSKIYTSEMDNLDSLHKLFVYDFTAPDSMTFHSSKTRLKSEIKDQQYYLRRAINDKIYIASGPEERRNNHFVGHYLTIINNPNSDYIDLDFETYIMKDGRLPIFGLQTIPSILNERGIDTNCYPIVNSELTSTNVKIGDRFCVNGTLSFECAEDKTLDSLTIKYQYNPNILKFEYADIEYELENHDSISFIILKMDLSNFKIYKEINFQLCFTALLHTDNLTEVFTYFPDDSLYTVDKNIPSIIKTEHCEQDIRLIKGMILTDFIYIIDPNNLEIKLTTEEQGKFEIILLNNLGQEVKKESYITSKETYISEIITNIDISDLANGNYFIRLISPHGKKHTKTLILNR